MTFKDRKPATKFLGPSALGLETLHNGIWERRGARGACQHHQEETAKGQIEISSDGGAAVPQEGEHSVITP